MQPVQHADRRAVGRRRAIAGVGAAILSLFLLPPILGLAGAALGASAIRSGERRLGWAAVGLAVSLSLFSTWLALQLVHRL
jgi:hypothetical protein